jgi:hypothetical protein
VAILQSRSAPEVSRQARGAVSGRLSPEYREVVDETVALLHQYKARLQHLQRIDVTAPYPEDQMQGITHDLWVDWRTVWSDAAQCLCEIAGDNEHLRAAKDYTESQLTTELMGAPLWRQAYAKPLGYPGDYQVMDYIYQGSARGDTPFAQVAHALGVLIGQFVVKRKDFVREAIAAVAARRRGSGATVIASLGAGPAQEIVELLQRDECGANPLTFILVDQDSGALRCAGRNLSAANAARRVKSPGRIDLRHLSVLRLLREDNPADLLAQPDMIYSAGLFDYFSDRTCRVLAGRLYDALPPGGLLLLGNMKAGTDMIWPLEMIADWSLTYRTADSVLSWADSLPGAEIVLRTEATGYDYLLSVRKR